MSILKKENRMVLITGIMCVLILSFILNYTFSFFQVQKTNNSVITGQVESMKLSVVVTRVAPTTETKLIPQQEEVIDLAVTGTTANCIDGNGNTVCHVYKVTLTNQGSSSALVSGTLVLDNKSNPNLKWAQISGLSNPAVIGNKNLPSVTRFVRNEEYAAGATKDYYVVVWINETGLVQTDTGNYTGTITFTTVDANAVGATGSTFLIMPNYTVGGSSQTTLPKGSYTVTPNCTNATATFDYEKWGLRISSLNTSDTATCSPTLTSTTTRYLNTYIKNNLTGTTQGTGSVVNENGYRYEGADPNNYIRFNDELWRIIGVFETQVVNDDNTTETKYLTKIIRNDSLGGFSWNKKLENIWPTSSLYQILNNYYYTLLDGTESEYCYQSISFKGNCNFTIRGINAIYRSMIEKVTWYLGGYSSVTTAANFYTYERSTSNTYYSSANTSYKTATGHIGLMYASDYRYSAWLYKNGSEWTITHMTKYAYSAFYIGNTGSLNSSNVNTSRAVRPVLYLDSSTYIVSGDGSEATPYIITI